MNSKVLSVYLLIQESDSKEIDKMKRYSSSQGYVWKNSYEMKKSDKKGIYTLDIEQDSRRLLYTYVIILSQNGHLYITDPDADDYVPTGLGEFYFVKFGDESD